MTLRDTTEMPAQEILAISQSKARAQVRITATSKTDLIAPELRAELKRVVLELELISATDDEL